MKLSFIKPVYAHCDLPCGVYDPAQALIEAKSVMAIQTKYNDLDEHNKMRAVILKEERAELVKHHLLVLWADYFKPEHLEKYPDLHDKFWKAIKQASECKHHLEVEEGKKLVAQIQEIADIFWETKGEAKKA
ncbi:MAG TPA: superoxide dismutase, Ni [Candidatus Saccharimonadales bacterium]|nr:superoxide dismutase, Ni [Candidatus Saccharimonadales bacterium]